MPLLAVARELRKKSPKAKLIYAGERSAKFSHILQDNRDLFYKDSYIYAGKLRRYHGEPWLSRITDIKTILLNMRDLAFVALGFAQSVHLLRKTRPDVIFIKGGYVGLPVGLAARLLKIPYITHDSDAIAGLTNKLIGHGAIANAVGMKHGFYKYPREKLVFVGVPSRKGFKKMTDAQIKDIRRELDIPLKAQVVLITGGSQGARRLNDSLSRIIPSMIKKNVDLVIIHQLGGGNIEQYESYNHPRLRKVEFIDELEKYSAAADLIITRAGASALSEYSDQAKPCIVVPSPYLTGGHQLRNGDVLRRAEAAMVISEGQMSDSMHAEKAIQHLLSEPKKRQELGQNLSKLMIHNAGSRIAKMILDYKNL